MRYPVYAPALTEADLAAGYAAIRSGDISGSGGAGILALEQRFAAYCGCEYGVATSSGSTALHLAAVVAGIGHGHEVLVSALTNIATANAIALCGGIVVPVDSEPTTWNLDPALLESLVATRLT